MALVFQYGSNMSTERLNADDRLKGDAQSLGLSRTIGQYQLGFTVWSDGNGCAASDLVRARGKHVWGVLYKIPDHLIARNTSGSRRSLDAIEGPRYRRRKIRIFMEDEPDTPIWVWTYTVISREIGHITSCEYATHILHGLREHCAPDEYIEHVKYRILRNNPNLRECINNI